MSPASRRLDAIVGAHRRGVMLRRLLRRLATTAGVCLLLASLPAAVFIVFPWTVLPLIWGGCLLAALPAGMFIGIDTLLLRPVSAGDVAAMLDRQSGQAHPLCALALQLRELSAIAVSGALVQESLERALHRLAETQPHIRGVYSHRATGWLVAGGVATLFSLLPASRIARYWDLPLRAGQVRTVVSPGSITVARGSVVTLQARPSSAQIPSCMLSLRAPDGS